MNIRSSCNKNGFTQEDFLGKSAGQNKNLAPFKQVTILCLFFLVIFIVLEYSFRYVISSFNYTGIIAAGVPQAVAVTMVSA